MASTLTWATYELAKNPRIVQKAKQEVPWMCGRNGFLLKDQRFRLGGQWCRKNIVWTSRIRHGVMWCDSLFVKNCQVQEVLGGRTPTYQDAAWTSRVINEKEILFFFFFSEGSGGFMKLVLKTFKTVWWQAVFKMFQQLSSSHATISILTLFA